MKSRAEARRALGIRRLKCVGSRLLVFAVAVVALLQLASGCDHPGKTASEVHRQHRRTIPNGIELIEGGRKIVDASGTFHRCGNASINIFTSFSRGRHFS